MSFSLYNSILIEGSFWGGGGVGKLLNVKCVFQIFSNILSEIFLILKNSPRYYHKCLLFN